jgi:hypothetical protein
MGKSPKLAKRTTKRPQRRAKSPPDFIAVARSLECDEDKGRFEAQLAKIAKAKVTGPIKGSRAAK